ncbi:hypothetical protein [Thermoactinomyces mirandus]|nr:hypothetical protein [Thermoactinomyces mirandus]
MLPHVLANVIIKKHLKPSPVSNAEHPEADHVTRKEKVILKEIFPDAS